MAPHRIPDVRVEEPDEGEDRGFDDSHPPRDCQRLAEAGAVRIVTLQAHHQNPNYAERCLRKDGKEGHSGCHRHGLPLGRQRLVEATLWAQAVQESCERGQYEDAQRRRYERYQLCGDKKVVVYLKQAAAGVSRSG